MDKLGGTCSLNMAESGSLCSCMDQWARMAMVDCLYSRNYVFWQDGACMSRLENCSACRRGNNSHSSKAHLYDLFPDIWLQQNWGAALPDVRGTVSGYDRQNDDVSAQLQVFVHAVREK